MMDDLKIIKKKYGEKMMHLCRELFPSLLETPGLLSNLLLKHFEPSRFLYDDIINQKMVEEFKNFIYTFIDVEKENKILETKSPKELLSEAGYDLYECKTEEDIQYFKKYYKPEEELCTFRGGRLDTCDVFFAVKKWFSTFLSFFDKILSARSQISMIKELSISGFRGFGIPQTVKFAVPQNSKPGSGLTIITGANNSGKTTIIESIRAFNSSESPSFLKTSSKKVYVNVTTAICKLGTHK